MKKTIRLFSILILIEVGIFFFAQWRLTNSIIQNKWLINFLVILLIFLSSSFVMFLIASFINKKFTDTLLQAIFIDNLVAYIILIFICAVFFIASSVFFIIADTLHPEVYEIFMPFAIFFLVLSCEIFILISFTRKEMRNKPKYWVSLPLLLAGNYFLRHTLEQSGLHMKPFFSLYLIEEAENVFSTYKWWQFLLPIKEFTGIWNFNLVLTHLVENVIGAPGAWYLYQAILIVVAFFLSWKVFKSEVFSYFISLCLGFGTQLYHTYQVPGSVGYYLLHTMFIILLYLAYKFIRSEKNSLKWFLLMIPALLFTAIYYEGWLDFFAAVWLASIFLFFYFKKHKKNQFIKRLAIVFGLYNVIALIYIYIKFTYVGFSHAEGIESDVVFNYPYFWPIVEDMVSNYFSHMYITLINFLPPPFISSNSLYYYSAAELIEQQFGYHPAMTYLVPYHYMFLWRYFAGALTALFFVFFIWVLQKTLKEKNHFKYLPLMLFLIMTAANGPTHTLVKIRPMNTMPVLGYHVLVGVLGFSLTISYLTHLYLQSAKNKKIAWAVLAFVGVVILYSSIARPKILWHMIEQVGLDVQGPYPNPMKTILFFLRNIFPGFLR